MRKVTAATTTNNNIYLTLIVLCLGAHDLDGLQPGRDEHGLILWASISTAKIATAVSIAATVGATVAITGFKSVCPLQQKRRQLASKR